MDPLRKRVSLILLKSSLVAVPSCDNMFNGSGTCMVTLSTSMNTSASKLPSSKVYTSRERDAIASKKK